MKSLLFKTSGLQAKEKTIAHWYPDPSPAAVHSYTGYSPPKYKTYITWEYVPGIGKRYFYKGIMFETDEAAVAYQEGAYVSTNIAAGPATYSPQIGYYYTSSGKLITNKYYVRDPMTGLPITVKAAIRF